MAALVPNSRWRRATIAYAAAALVQFIALISASLSLPTKSARDDSFVATVLIAIVTIVCVTIWYPRLWVALAGSTLLFFVILFGSTLRLGIPILAGYGVLVLPYLAATLLIAALGSWALVLPWRRVSQGPIDLSICHACGYSLRATSSSRCPECGQQRTELVQQ